MIYGEWKIRIVDPGYKLKYDVFIFRELPDQKAELLNVGIIDSGVAPKPSLELDKFQLQAFADELSNMGIKPQQGFVEGKLEATERHLADTRKLLKLTE